MKSETLAKGGRVSLARALREEEWCSRVRKRRVKSNRVNVEEARDQNGFEVGPMRALVSTRRTC